ncbi:RNA 2'-phosphotransferase [Spirosoma knui]
MISEKEATLISKFISLVLRHSPETIGISLDANGWASTAELINRMNQRGYAIDQATLAYIVETNPKKRFALNEHQTLIRASQGHSVTVELGYTPTTPPEHLYHGTSEKNLPSILATGLNKRDRHHVHLSTDAQTAQTVGSRHGRPVVLEVDSQAMHKDGFLFFISANGVWLTDHVPAHYLKVATTVDGNTALL